MRKTAQEPDDIEQRSLESNSVDWRKSSSVKITFHEQEDAN